MSWFSFWPACPSVTRSMVTALCGLLMKMITVCGASQATRYSPSLLVCSLTHGLSTAEVMLWKLFGSSEISTNTMSSIVNWRVSLTLWSKLCLSLRKNHLNSPLRQKSNNACGRVPSLWNAGKVCCCILHWAALFLKAKRFFVPHNATWDSTGAFQSF